MSEQLKLINEKIIFSQHASAEEARIILSEIKHEGISIGTDEAGRGCLAGPVVAAAVYLTEEQEKNLLALNLKDSKLLSEAKREKLFSAMNDMKVFWRAFMGSPAMIDEKNILQVSLYSMKMSVLRLVKILPNSEEIFCVIVDGNMKIPELVYPQWNLIKADMKIPAVSAASIVAKVLRDRLMKNYSQRYPKYDFAKNKGYPTRFHIEALKDFGITEIHRKSFCRKFV